MSIKTMSQVWEQSRVKGTDKLALLALADYANDDGFCFPSYGSFAKKVGVAQRQAMRVVSKLEALGEIWVIERPGHRNYYVVLTGQDRAGIIHRLTQCGQVPKDDIPAAVELIMERQRGVVGDTRVTDDRSGGVTDDRSGVSRMTPKPSKNHQRQPSPKRIPANGTRAAQDTFFTPPEQKPAATGQHQVIIDAFIDELGYRPANMGREGKAAKWLVQHEYSPEQVLACYRHMKADKFWSDKFLSLQKVSEQIAEYTRAAAPRYTMTPSGARMTS